MIKNCPAIFSFFRAKLPLLLTALLLTGCQAQELSMEQLQLLDGEGRPCPTRLVMLVDDTLTLSPTLGVEGEAFTCSVTDEAVLSAGLAGDTLTLQALSPGSAQVVLSYTAPGYSQQSFPLEVEVTLRQQSFGWTLVPLPDEAQAQSASFEAAPDEEILQEDRLTVVSGSTLAVALNSQETADFSVEVTGSGVEARLLDGDVLLISGLAPGEGAITVTASKEGYEPLERTLTVQVSLPVLPVTLSPQSGGSLGELVLELGEETSLGVGLPEGVTGSITAESNSPAVTAEVSGGALRLLGREKGTSKVVVTVSAPGYEPAVLPLAVEVTGKRAPLTLVSDRFDGYRQVGLTTGETQTIQVTYEGELSFSYASDQLKVERDSDGNLAVTALAPGEAALTITCKAQGLEDNHQTISYQVSDAPLVLTVSDTNLHGLLGEKLTVTYSTDPGDAEVTASVSSGGAQVLCRDGVLTVTPDATGSGTITLVAQKEGYSPAQQVITLTVGHRELGFSIAQTQWELQPGEKTEIPYTIGAEGCTFDLTATDGVKVWMMDDRLYLTAQKDGTATVTASREGYGSQKIQLKVTVGQSGEETQLADQLFDLTNQARAEAGLSPLTRMYDVEAGAQLRASEIAESFDHTRPDGSGFYTVFGVEENYSYGENIAEGFDTAQQALDGWMASQGHRENILDPEYTGMGVGTVQQDGRRYWVQIFYRGDDRSSGVAPADPQVN